MRTRLFNLNEDSRAKVEALVREGSPPWTIDRFLIQEFGATFREAIQYRKELIKKVREQNIKPHDKTTDHQAIAAAGVEE